MDVFIKFFSWVKVLYEDGDGNFHMISIDDSGIVQRRQEAETCISRVGRNHVECIASASQDFLSKRRLFGEIDIDPRHVGRPAGIMEFDDFDLTTGKKVRTLSTGFTHAPFSRDGCDICHVFSNDTAVYCTIKDADNGHLVIQSFLS
jgi:hypothetical protein